MEKRKKSKAEIARNMGAIRSTGGLAEVKLRSILHRRGFRFRKNYKSLRGKPDVVFLRERIAVFVDGDYWHGRMVKEKGAEYLKSYFDENQQQYWVGKIVGNIARDAEVTSYLESEGWLVLRFWESEVKRNPDAAADQVVEAIANRRKLFRRHNQLM